MSPYHVGRAAVAPPPASPEKAAESEASSGTRRPAATCYLRDCFATVCVERDSAAAPLGLVFDAACTVSKVVAGSPAARGGVVPGMRILGVNGVAVASPAEAKAASAGSRTLVMAAVLEGSRRLRGSVASWDAERGFGAIAPDVPLFVSAGVGETQHPSVHTGRVFFHLTNLRRGAWVPKKGAGVEFTAVRAGNRFKAFDVATSGDTQRGEKKKREDTVTWWNVNNLNECNRVVFSSPAAGSVSYSKNDVARPPVSRLVFDAATSAVSMPDIGKCVRVPQSGCERDSVLAGLRALAERAGIQHNIPTRAAGFAGEGAAASAGGASLMTAAATAHVWVGWTGSAAVRTRVIRDVAQLFVGNVVVERMHARKDGRLGCYVRLGTPVTQAQLAELNTRCVAGERVVVNDAEGGDAPCREALRMLSDAPPAALTSFAEVFGSVAAASALPPPSRRSCVRRVRRSVAELQAAVQRADASFADAQKNCCDTRAALPHLGHSDKTLMCDALTDVLEEFLKPAYVAKYGGMTHDIELARGLAVGDPVPSYFANTGSESIFLRKVLSIAGLRNLVLHGRDIFMEMRATLFAGNPATYVDGEGPDKMRTFTGNVVDLDTVVLRASDPVTLATINLSNKHKGLPTHNSTHAFANSTQAGEIAVTSAEALLNKFSQDFQLTTAQAGKRLVDAKALPAPGSIPVATHNTDRGMWPCWRYTNVGVDSFHANVPCLEDVNGALLRAPLHCVKAWVYALETNDEASFFEDCIVDSCFNMKWKAIEAYCEEQEKRGSIRQVLEALQVTHQAALSRLYDVDDSEEAEVEAMMGFLEKGARGRSVQDGMRPITRADIAVWVANPAVDL